MNLPVITTLLGMVVLALIVRELLVLVKLPQPVAALSVVKDQIKKAWRLWHPRTLDDCALCATPVAIQLADIVEVTPWSVLKSPRGARKRISSEGIACQNEACRYFGCSVQTIHAMVSDGCRGRTDRIRRWKCQACGMTVTERKDTVLYRLKTRPGRIIEVMALMANGLDPSAGSRVFRHDDRTIQRWLKRGGRHARHLHDLYFESGFTPKASLLQFGDPKHAGNQVLCHGTVLKGCPCSV